MGVDVGTDKAFFKSLLLQLYCNKGFGLPHTDENFYNKNLGNCMDYTDYPSTDMHPDHSNFVFLAAMYEPTTNASSMANNSLAPITTGFGNYGGNGATMQPWGQGGGTSSSSQGNQAGGNGGAGHGNGMGGHFHSGNRRHLRAPVHQREEAATDQVPQWLAQWHEIQEADMMAKSQSLCYDKVAANREVSQCQNINKFDSSKVRVPWPIS